MLGRFQQAAFSMAHIVKDSKETEEHLDRVEDKQLPQIAKDAVHVVRVLLRSYLNTVLTMVIAPEERGWL